MHITEDYSLLVSVFAIALTSVSVYQGFRISANAKQMATGMAEDMFVSSKELFAQLYMYSPVPYIHILDDGTIQSTNVSARRLFDAKKEELEHLNAFEYLACEPPLSLSVFLEEFNHGLFVNSKEVKVTRPDGTTRWALLSLFPFKGRDGRKEGLLTLVDITKQKQVDKAKTEFVSLASHQLGTPIAAMKWNVELLLHEREALSDSAHALAEKIQGNLTRMQHLVRDFLTSSKFELGTFTAAYAQADIGELLNEIIEEQKDRIVEGGIHIHTKMPETPVVANTDKNLIHMVVGNLLSNAIKYTPNVGMSLLN